MPTRIDKYSNRTAAQLDEPVQPIAHPLGRAGADMVDQAGPAPRGQRHHRPGDVSNVDEIAPTVQIADAQLERIMPGFDEPAGEMSQCLTGRSSRTDRVE